MSAELDASAGEYVLGTLDAAERTAFVEHLRHDADAQGAVAAWERRLAGLDQSVGSVAPSPQTWTRIEAAVAAFPRPPQSFRVIDGGFTSAPKLKTSRDRWRAAAIFSGSIAAALLVFVAQREVASIGRGVDNVSYVAAVNRGGDKPALLIRVDLKTRQVFVRPIAAETPAGHSLELWYIGSDKPPRSLGLVDKTPSTLEIPKGANATGATFAVSVEPQGGSKSPGPTGPVVYAGQLIKD